MLNGAARVLRRKIAGLLVLTILLISGTPLAAASWAQAYPQNGPVAGQVVHAAGHGQRIPAGHEGCDDGLLCCIGSQCVIHASWIPAANNPLPDLRRIAAAASTGRHLPLVGISTPPASPPPRTSV